MLVEVRAGLNRINRGVDLAQRTARGEQGKLMFGYTINTLCNVMPPIIRQFRERYPQIELVLFELTPPVMERQLLNEDIDIGIVSSIGMIMPGLAHETIYQEKGVVALPKNHPLAHRATISLRELAGEPFVMYARGVHRELFDEIISLCRLAGFSPTIVQEAANEAALISLVAAGLGVALVSSSLSGLLTDEVIYCPLVEPLVRIEVALEWKEDRHLPWLQELRQIAQEVKRRTVIDY
jgi:DNA-binding transcriptional LysR family regulator